MEPAATGSAASLRAVVFDCLGTLLELEPPAPLLRAELSRRGVEVGEREAEDAFRREIDYYLAHHMQGSDAAGLNRLRDACARVVADALDLPGAQLALVRAAMLAALRFSPREGAERTLRTLRARGLGLAVASNWDCSLADVLSSAGIAPLVDAVVTSAEVGAAKPDPELFRAALRAIGFSPEQALCVGDSPERDVAGARAAGIEAILLDATAREAPPGAALARSLDEALSLILARA